MARAFAVRVGSITAGQSAVSLVAADGETLSGGVQSNFAGNGFYTRNGFSRAANWAGPNPLGGNFAGFDDPAFIPITTWLTDYGGMSAATAYSRMNDLGLNGCFPMSGAIGMADLITYGKWAVVPNDVAAGGTISNTFDPAIVGVSTGEEPSDTTGYQTIRAAADTWLASSDGPGRFHQFNFADQLMNGDISNAYFPKDMVTGWVTADGGTRSRRQFTTCDQYWFAGSGVDDSSRSKLHSRLYYDEFTASGAATSAQTARGSHYGSAMDSVRKAFATSPNTLPGGPVGMWVEAAAPYASVNSLAITAAQLKWAVWATLVHGARGIFYFVHNFRTGDSWGSAFWDDHFGAPGVTGTGIYAAAKEVNLRALQIAPVLNSPMDGYFVYGDLTSGGAIATAGFLTAVTSTNARSKYGGVDASCRWYPTGGKHYILATTREVESATNVPITCRMVDQGQTAATPVFGGSAITITRGGAIPAGFCEFSDTFALASDYKCWRVD